MNNIRIEIKGSVISVECLDQKEEGTLSKAIKSHEDQVKELMEAAEKQIEQDKKSWRPTLISNPLDLVFGDKVKVEYKDSNGTIDQEFVGREFRVIHISRSEHVDKDQKEINYYVGLIEETNPNYSITWHIKHIVKL